MEELVIQAKSGNSDAFATLITDQKQNMYKVARSYLSNDEDAADAIGDAILICWEKIGQLKNETYFRTWMTRILINCCKKIYSQNKLYHVTQIVPEEGVTEMGYHNLEWIETLNTLDEKYRTIIILYYAEGFKSSEIAEILDLPEATVRTRMSRGREKLKQLYNITDRSEAI